jgi:hypothetical protein
VCEQTGGVKYSASVAEVAACWHAHQVRRGMGGYLSLDVVPWRGYRLRGGSDSWVVCGVS